MNLLNIQLGPRADKFSLYGLSSVKVPFLQEILKTFASYEVPIRTALDAIKKEIKVSSEKNMKW